MANNPLPPYVRINREDLGNNLPSWIDGLLGPMNLNFQANYSLFNGGLNEQINIDSQIQSISFATPSSYVDGIASTFTAQTFKSTLTGVPTGYIVVNIVNTSSTNTVFAKPVFASCSYNNGSISVNFVTGLEANQNYNLTLKVF